MKKPAVRIGDFVDIIDPRLFIRCGYPMYLPDVQKELAADEGIQNAISQLMYPESRAPHLVSDLDYTKVQQRARERILFELAKVKANREGFGGDTRSIYLTEPDLALQGRRVRVVGSRRVKTGKRFGPSGGYSYDGEYGYEPGGLEKEETHVILSFKYPHAKPCELYSTEMASIPRDHVRLPELWGLRHKSGKYLCDNMINTVTRKEEHFYRTWGGWSREYMKEQMYHNGPDWKMVLMQKGDPVADTQTPV